MLVAGSYDDDREGSIKKGNFKCLSCDKDSENKLLKIKENFKENIPKTLMDEDFTGRNIKKSESVLNIRCNTSRMRRNIRLNTGSTKPRTNQGTIVVTP